MLYPDIKGSNLPNLKESPPHSEDHAKYGVDTIEGQSNLGNELSDEIIVNASIFADQEPQDLAPKFVPPEVIEPSTQFPIEIVQEDSGSNKLRFKFNPCPNIVQRDFSIELSMRESLPAKKLPLTSDSTKHSDSEFLAKGNVLPRDLPYNTKVCIPLPKLLPTSSEGAKRIKKAADKALERANEEKKYARYCSNFLSRVIFQQHNSSTTPASQNLQTPSSPSFMCRD